MKCLHIVIYKLLEVEIWLILELAVLAHCGNAVTFAGGLNANSQLTLTTGGSKAHNKMPPYLTVYMWKRTA